MANEQLVNTLKIVLANSYSLYLKSQNYHWNVVGPNFQSLHALFEEHYTDLAEAVDEIAERIRAIGSPAPGGFEAFTQLRTVSDGKDSINAKEMVTDLAKDHEEVLQSIKNCFNTAQTKNDEVTLALMTDRMTFHEKAIWMLKSSLA